MCDESEFEVCRLCLNSHGLLMNVFGGNSKLQFMLEKAIEDLIDVKVVEDANYPWLVCSTCMEKLTEFRLFKRRCAECLSVFYNRTQKGCNPATKDWVTNRCTNELCDDAIVSDVFDKKAVDVPGGMISVKEENDPASECSASAVQDIESLMVASIQEGCSHWSDNEEAGNLNHSRGDEEVIKEEWDMDIPQGGGLGADVSQEQDNGLEKDWAGKEGGQEPDSAGHLWHKCQLCNKVFKERHILKAHLRRMHLEKERQLRCDICSNTFEFESDLHAHVKLVHPVRKEYQCQQCSRHFHNMNDLQIHCLTHTLERPYKCEICWKAFTEKTMLGKHILTHTGDRSYKCEVCSKAYSRKSHLTRHMWAHTGKRLYKCRICYQEFTQTGVVSKHMLTHSGVKTYKCETCSKEFSRKGAVKRHMLTHTSEKSYKCEVCSRAFTLKEALKRHMSTHTGVKSYKCEICSRAFNRNENLQCHMLTHTGERPHKCQVCSKAFTQYSILKKHMVTHTGQKLYKCEKAFAHQQRLEGHSLTHSVERH
ncbi:zinc finger protein 117-like isoform X2 [Hetaerina americana]|uniref:zinc finger protein 117-like isoform X2 n=1 Tax=Hetaerina americana TaxID=62018 RepID=UPI003A7F46DC